MSGWSSTIRRRIGIGVGLIGRAHLPTRCDHAADNDAYRSWLVRARCCCSACWARRSRSSSRIPRSARAGRCLRSGSSWTRRSTLAAVLVAVLAGIRFSVEGRRLDLLLCGGFGARGRRTSRSRSRPCWAGNRCTEPSGWAGDRRPATRLRILIAVGGVRARAGQRRRRVASTRLPSASCVVLRLVAPAHSVTRCPPRLGGRRRRRADGRARRAGDAARCSRSSASGALPRRARGPRPLARARRDAGALRRAALRLHAARLEPTCRRATSCGCSRTACCSSACGARSAAPSSVAQSRRSAPESPARSTTVSRSTCSRSPRTRRCSSTAPTRARCCRS